MQKIQFIKDIAAGDEVDDLFLLAGAGQGQARNGLFWRLELKDKTGSLDAKIWSPLSQQIEEPMPGRLVRVSGRAGLYRDRLDLNIESFQQLSADAWNEVDAPLFVPAAARPSEEMWAELEALCAEVMRHPPWKKFAQLLLKDEFVSSRLKVAPAAKGAHHAFRGGMLEHTLGVARLCMAFADLYPELDRQALLAGAICHDLGKLWELSDGASIDYTDSGRLLGHIYLGLEALGPIIKKSGLEPELALHLKHLILSHHGELDAGSPRRPKTAEAFALHFADNFDARMAMLRDVYAAMPGRPEAEGRAAGQPARAAETDGRAGPDNACAEGAEPERPGLSPCWSPYHNLLSRFIYRPLASPQGKAPPKSKVRAEKLPARSSKRGRADAPAGLPPDGEAAALLDGELLSHQKNAGGSSSLQGSLLGGFPRLHSGREGPAEGTLAGREPSEGRRAGADLTGNLNDSSSDRQFRTHEPEPGNELPGGNGPGAGGASGSGLFSAGNYSGADNGPGTESGLPGGNAPGADNSGLSPETEGLAALFRAGHGSAEGSARADNPFGGRDPFAPSGGMAYDGAGESSAFRAVPDSVTPPVLFDPGLQFWPDEELLPSENSDSLNQDGPLEFLPAAPGASDVFDKSAGQGGSKRSAEPGAGGPGSLFPPLPEEEDK